MISDSELSYPITDSQLPFADYLKHCRKIIKDRRMDLKQPREITEKIINANCPFELSPDQPVLVNNQPKYGVLLIHGLLDCPFSLRDIAARLQANGMLVRSILLPGHGTHPSDLLSVSYHDWIQAVRYGVENLKREVNTVFLVGYSTGATLSVYQALQDKQIAGIILLSPAIKIKVPVNLVVSWHYLASYMTKNKRWISKEDEIDYAKYHSVPFNAVEQVSQLTDVIRKLGKQHGLHTPVFMIMSREDETVSSHNAINFFSSLHHANSKMLLYSSYDHLYPDPRIKTRVVHYPKLHIRHFSHMCVPFSPANAHYGQHGDYEEAAHVKQNEYIYGAYNLVEVDAYHVLYRLGLIGHKRRELTYNPDFDFMADNIVEFIKQQA